MRTPSFDTSTLLQAFDRAVEMVAAEDQKSGRKEARAAGIVRPKPKPSHPLLYLPVEVKAREFKSKAWIARKAANRGLRVILGASWGLNDSAPMLPPGAVLFKSVHSIDAENMMRWAEAGHRIALLDEEIYGINPTSEYLRAVVHPHIPVLADLICAQSNRYKENFPHPAKIALTGNPRVLEHSPRSSQGREILVCLQSGNTNHAALGEFDMTTVCARVLRLAPQPMRSAQGRAWAGILRSSIDHECRYMPVMARVIEALARAFPDRRVVVRPHPIENAKAWAFDASNVAIESGGDIVTAMKTAAVLVYVSGCTTGLDAALAGAPAGRIGEGGVGLSALLNRACADAPAVVDAVKAILEGHASVPDLKAHFAEVDIATPLLELFRQDPASGHVNIDRFHQGEMMDYRRRKFPDTEDGELAALVGRPVQRIAWNTWFI